MQGLTDFYRYYFLPRVGALPPEVRTKATLAMLRDMPSMPDLGTYHRRLLSARSPPYHGL